MTLPQTESVTTTDASTLANSNAPVTAQTQAPPEVLARLGSPPHLRKFNPWSWQRGDDQEHKGSPTLKAGALLGSAGFQTCRIADFQVGGPSHHLPTAELARVSPARLSKVQRV
jgi:hypothetical protein